MVYDALVVGSGASGGWACKRLAEAGLRIALVDAGRPQPDSNFREHQPAYQLPYRNLAPELLKRTQPVQSQCYACTEFNSGWFCNDLDEPYTTPKDKPFTWQGRLRRTGGRTNVWGRQSYRLSDLDMQAASRDGYGVDWPIRYRDLAPYYDIVEEYVGITGMAEGLPQLPDGRFQPPMGLTCAEQMFRGKVKEKLGWTVTLGRSANLTKSINGRAPCHYCGPCEHGCITHSYFNSAFTTVADALRTGRCDHIPNAMVYQVLMNPDTNRARGVLYVDRDTRQTREVHARAVLLCAQAQESVRVLFNSANRQHPRGLGNSSGDLGHYLMDHISGMVGAGEVEVRGGKATINGPNRPDGIYVPRFRNIAGQPRAKNFIRGYGMQGSGSTSFNWSAPGFGAAYVQGLRQSKPYIGLVMFGECLARRENRVEIDPERVDAFGIPILKISMRYGENEAAMLRDAYDTASEMLAAVGSRNELSPPDMSVPGAGIHEVGIARMGADPKHSVLTPFQQTHDIENLFVMDGSGFPSTACQNPTLTIMALCVRSCDHLLERFKRSEI